MDDSGGFERVYGEHASPIRNFLRLHLGDGAAAEDLTQETFLQFWSRSTAFDPTRASLRAYLFGIARKKAADWRRKNSPLVQSSQEKSMPAREPALLADALNRLAPEFREILWLREVEGYSYAELGDILRIPVGTVRSRLHSAREELRLIWNRKEDCT